MTSDPMVGVSRAVTEVRLSDDAVYWLERRPEQGGRYARTARDRLQECRAGWQTPDPARSGGMGGD